MCANSNADELVRMAAVLKSFEDMTKQQQDAFLQLCMEPPEIANWDKTTVRERQVLAIFKTNEFGTGDVFELASRFNHSCSPNLNHIGRGAKKMFYARRHIKADEELTISYIDESLPLEERQFKLGRWKFTCRCIACDGSEEALGIEKKRLEIMELGKSLNEFPNVLDYDRSEAPAETVLHKIIDLHVQKSALLNELCFRPWDLTQRYI